MKKNEMKSGAAPRRNEYANGSEFCAIFMNDLNSLYSLALMLTGNSGNAEECVAGALEDCLRAAGAVFKPWAKSWSRLSVIERAIRMVTPKAAYASESLADVDNASNLPNELASVIRLDAFRRFVYVLAVLEKYSIREVAILLKHGKQEVAVATKQAMRLLGEAQKEVSELLPTSSAATLIA
jgi:hypothetical protein